MEPGCRRPRGLFDARRRQDTRPVGQAGRQTDGWMDGWMDGKPGMRPPLDPQGPRVPILFLCKCATGYMRLVCLPLCLLVRMPIWPGPRFHLRIGH